MVYVLFDVVKFGVFNYGVYFVEDVIDDFLVGYVEDELVVGWGG